MNSGYPYFKYQIREHIVVAERVLGHELPPKAQVHHVDCDRANNRPGNLVICEDQAYHSLLHMRTRALAACGNANWLKCAYCRCYDHPLNLTTRLTGSKSQSYHKTCRATYEQNRKARRRWRTFGEIAHSKTRPDYQNLLGQML